MKFNNKRTKDGFRSLFEREVSKQLKRHRRVKVSYESHSISYSIPRVYHPDFVVTLPNGHTIYVEAKGYFRQEDKVKMKCVKLCNPTLDIRMIFPRKNKKDIAWCTKMGIPYAVGSIPKDWLV
jgi:predicted nuclease of restriction endonuclease-like RecB superfamily